MIKYTVILAACLLAYFSIYSEVSIFSELKKEVDLTVKNVVYGEKALEIEFEIKNVSENDIWVCKEIGYGKDTKLTLKELDNKKGLIIDLSLSGISSEIDYEEGLEIKYNLVPSMDSALFTLRVNVSEKTLEENIGKVFMRIGYYKKFPEKHRKISDKERGINIYQKGTEGEKIIERKINKRSSAPQLLNFTLSSGKKVAGLEIKQEYPLEKLKLNGREWLENRYELLDEHFGKSESFQISPKDAIESDKKCYFSTQKGDNTLVVFKSGPMGGYGNFIDGIDIYLDKNNFEGLEKCVPSKNVNRNMTFENGLKLNIDKKRVKKILGNTITYEDENLLLYDFSVFKIITGKDGKNTEYQRFRFFEMIFAKNKLSYIQIAVGDST